MVLLKKESIYDYIHLDHIEVFMLHYYGGTPTRFEIHTVSGNTPQKHILSYETCEDSCLVRALSTSDITAQIL